MSYELQKVQNLDSEISFNSVILTYCKSLIFSVPLYLANLTFSLIFKNAKLKRLADTRVNHTGVLAVSNYLGSSVAAAILTFVLNSLYGFNYEKINICSHFIT